MFNYSIYDDIIHLVSLDLCVMLNRIWLLNAPNGYSILPSLIPSI